MAAAADPVGEGLDQPRAGLAHVPADDAAVRAVGADDDLGEGGPQGVGDVGVELVWHGATDVVGLDDGGEGSRCHVR